MKPLNSLFKRIQLLVVVAVVAALMALAPLAPFAPQAQAATPNVSVGAGQVIVIPFHISGTISATITSIAKFNMPMPCELLGVGANAQAIVGTTNTIDVKLGGTTVLSAPITIAAAGTYTEGTIVTSAIGDEGVITIDVTIAGTSLTHITVFLTCARK